MPTVSEAWQNASKLIDRFEAKLLLASCLGVTRTYLITHDKDALAESVFNHYKKCVQERAKGVPVPYILGKQEFYGRPFKVTPAVLIPRPDTETIVEFVLGQCPIDSELSVLDLGTGSGCIAITLALENSNLNVNATDVSPAALEIAETNAKNLGADIHFYCGSWFEAIPASLRYDIIVSNPPYIHREDEHLKNLGYEPIGALTDGFDGLTHIDHIIKNAPSFLKKNGLLAFEHGWDQGESVRTLFRKHSLWKDIQTIQDLGGNDRVVFHRIVIFSSQF